MAADRDAFNHDACNRAAALIDDADLWDLPDVAALQRDPRPRELRGKRAFDVLVAGVGLVLSAPAQVGIAAAVRLDSAGPVIFAQTRVGRFGRPFTILKFRTMTVSDAGRAGAVTGGADPRITRVGAVLRATKLDELPQLVNVLRGDMSLVGPRPEVPRYVRAWDPRLRPLILAVRPGITDPASIAFRHEGRELAAVPDPQAYYVRHLLPRKTALYADYVRGLSWRADLLVLARTARAVFSR